MQSPGLLSQTMSWIIYGLSVTLFVLSCIRAYTIILKYSSRKLVFRLRKNRWLLAAKTIYGLCWIGFLAVLPITLFVTSPFRQFIPEGAHLLLWLSMTLLGIIEITGSFSVSPRMQQKKIWRMALLTVILVLSFNIKNQFSKASDVFSYPDVEKSLLIELPVEGRWTAGHAGASISTNYHNEYSSQRYAIDMFKQYDDGSFFQENGMQLANYATFGSPIYAPVAGSVVTVVDSLPNTFVSFSPNNSTTPAGNHVVIEMKPDTYVFLAHLDSGKIMVSEGDQVKEGDLLGLAGNSGNTSWPHLHLHIQDLPYIDAENATAYPFRFKSLKRKRWLSWRETRNDFILRNDVFEKSKNESYD